MSRIEIPTYRWPYLAAERATVDGKCTVHVVARLKGKVVVVKNLEKHIKGTNRIKQEGWGIPTGGVKAGMTPIQAIRDELHEEAGIQNFSVRPKPIDVSVKDNGHINICFLADINPNEELRPNVFDPTGETVDAAFIDPDTDISVVTEHEFRFRGERFYSSSRNLIYIALALEAEPV